VHPPHLISSNKWIIKMSSQASRSTANLSSQPQGKTRTPNSQTPKVRRVGTILNIETQKELAVIEFPVRDKFKTLPIEPAILIDKTKLTSFLVNKGVTASMAKAADGDSLANDQSAPLTKVTTLSGWHDNLLVTPYGVFGNYEGKPQVYFDPESNRSITCHTNGDFRTQIKNARQLLSRSSFMTITFLAALMAPLGARLGRKNGIGFCLSGESSSGKSLCARFGLSLLSRADDTDLEIFNVTDGELNERVSIFGGLLRTFNDVKSSAHGVKKVAQALQRLIFVTYGLEVRQSLLGHRKPNDQFTAFLVSIEEPMAKLFANAKIEYQASEAARCPEIPIPSVTEGGVFDLLAAPENSTDWAQKVDGFIGEAYGHVFPKWVKKLTEAPREKLKSFVGGKEREFLQEIALAGQDNRLAKPFALLYATACVAHKAGLLPIKLKMAKTAIEKALKLALEQKNRSLPKSGSMAVPDVSKTIQAFKLLARLPLVTKGTTADPVKCANGFRRIESRSARMRFVTKQHLAAQIGAPTYLTEVILPGLAKSRHLIAPKDGFTAPVTQDGLPGRRRYLRLAKEGLLEEVRKIMRENEQK
jgi:Domain of unknown function (DUF927)